VLNYFIERPVFSTVIALVMILVGALCYRWVFRSRNIRRSFRLRSR
jgi:multidrug efflux pump subunit AcrB